MAIEREVEVRRKRQLTWPEELATAMQVSEGSYLIIEYDEDRGIATVRRRPDSYAGAVKGIFGANDDEVAAYLDSEHSGWLRDQG